MLAITDYRGTVACEVYTVNSGLYNIAQITTSKLYVSGVCCTRVCAPDALEWKFPTLLVKTFNCMHIRMSE